jgi:DNA-binding XRE family transcriptional regulator
LPGIRNLKNHAGKDHNFKFNSYLLAMQTGTNDFEYCKKKLGATIKLLRTSKGISQNTLGACSGINKAALSRIENGECNPTVTTLFRISGCLQVPVTAIFSKD